MSEKVESHIFARGVYFTMLKNGSFGGAKERSSPFTFGTVLTQVVSSQFSLNNMMAVTTQVVPPKHARINMSRAAPAALRRHGQHSRYEPAIMNLVAYAYCVRTNPAQDKRICAENRARTLACVVGTLLRPPIVLTPTVPTGPRPNDTTTTFTPLGSPRCDLDHTDLQVISRTCALRHVTRPWRLDSQSQARRLTTPQC
jgi:hypothetical protein